MKEISYTSRGLCTHCHGEGFYNLNWNDRNHASAYRRFGTRITTCVYCWGEEIYAQSDSLKGIYPTFGRLLTRNPDSLGKTHFSAMKEVNTQEDILNGFNRLYPPYIK